MRTDLLPPPPGPKVPRVYAVEAIAKAEEMFPSQGGGPSDSSVVFDGAGIAKALPVRAAKAPPTRKAKAPPIQGMERARTHDDVWGQSLVPAAPPAGRRRLDYDKVLKCFVDADKRQWKEDDGKW